MTMMTKEREQMLDEVIKRYGFEAKETVNFARVCEHSIDDNNVKKVFKALMK
jgi:hypothetical protein